MADHCPPTIEIEGHTYVRADTMAEPDGDYVIVRGDRSASFAGYLEDYVDQQVTLSNARRLWYWSGAATLSELALKGPGKPTECKFPAAVPVVTILDAIEIIPCTEQARVAIQAVAEWSAS